MGKKKIEIIAAVALIVAFIFILSGSLKKVLPAFRRAHPRITAAGVSAPEKVKSLFDVDIAKKEIKAELEERESGYERDPFALSEISEGPVSAIADLKLTGITTNNKGRMIAIMNQDMVSAGDKIGHFTVVDITAKKVVVTDGKQNFELNLEE